METAKELWVPTIRETAANTVIIINIEVRTIG